MTRGTTMDAAGAVVGIVKSVISVTSTLFGAGSSATGQILDVVQQILKIAP